MEECWIGEWLGEYLPADVPPDFDGTSAVWYVLFTIEGGCADD